jgi:hypothetical protein
MQRIEKSILESIWSASCGKKVSLHERRSLALDCLDKYSCQVKRSCITGSSNLDPR